MSKYANEHVLVTPRPLFDELGSFDGFNPDAPRYLDTFLADGNNFYLPRDEAEDDPTHKQIIPYAIFHHNGRILHYVRGGASGEKRLASKGSVGIGGHINTEDEAASGMAHDAYLAGVARETEEELQIDCTYSQKIVGLINDDSNEVGRVHIGVVHRFDLESDAVAPNEAPITELNFFTKKELTERRDALESWSQICLDNWDAILSD